MQLYLRIWIYYIKTIMSLFNIYIYTLYIFWHRHHQVLIRVSQQANAPNLVSHRGVGIRNLRTYNIIVYIGFWCVHLYTIYICICYIYMYMLYIHIYILLLYVYCTYMYLYIYMYACSRLIYHNLPIDHTYHEKHGFFTTENWKMMVSRKKPTKLLICWWYNGNTTKHLMFGVYPI
jgi:hypothetical protein